MIRFCLLFAALAGCSDQLLAKRLYPPEVVILSPTDGETAWRDRALEVQARVEDLYTDDVTTLDVFWDTDNGTVTPTGWAPGGLALGSWVPARDGAARLSVLVVDPDAQEARDAVEPWVVTNGRPEVQITAPLDGEALRQDRSATLLAEATDDGGPNFLTVQWTLDGEPLDGCDSSTPDGALRCVQPGWAVAGAALELCVIATDALGLEGVACVQIDIDPCVDADGDGLTTCDDDCDDGDAGRGPGLPERCDGVDNDCDGEIDEGAGESHYPDADGDSFGDPSAPLTACEAPPGYVADATDCDDTRAAVNPGATEVCDSLDNDCDGQVDEGLSSTFYADADGDLYGNPAVSTSACVAPSGYVSDNTDCDDTDASIHPGVSPDLPEGVDSDCDGDDAPCGLSVRFVPAEYPTIQDAVDASCDGDRIEVSAGLYPEDVTVPRVLEIVGVDGSAVTTIQGSGTASVVSMGAGWLEGFTLTGGFASSGGGLYVGAVSGDWTGVDLRFIDNESGTWGGGAYIRGLSAVEIVDCTFEGNVAGSSGGGLFLYEPAGALIEDTTFVDNAASAFGAGVHLYGGASTVLRRLDFTGNTLGGGGAGAGLGLYQLTGGHADLESITFVDNGNTAFGGAAYFTGGTGSLVDVAAVGNDGQAGGGLFINSGVWDLAAIDLRDNGDFAALFVNPGARVTVANATLAGNRGAGAWVNGTGAALTLTNVDAVGNAGWPYGVGVFVNSGGTLTVVNATLTDNGTYGVYNNGGSVTIRHSNLYANGSGRVLGMADPTGTAGNIAVFPDYVSFSTALAATAWDLALNLSSALVDAGDPSILDVDGTRSDIGAYGGPGGSW